MAAGLGASPHLREESETPMDYHALGADEIEREAPNRTSRSAKTEFVTRVKTVSSRLSRDTVKAACGRFRSRLEAVADAEGSYFERWRT